MNNISCRLWGTCWGDPAAPVRLVVKWAGQQVFDGAVPTSSDTPNSRQTDQHGVVCTWTVNSITAGLVPVEITVHNGSASVQNIFFNNIVSGRYVQFKHNVVDLSEIYHPALPKQDVNVNTFTDEEFLASYGFSRDEPPAYVEYVDVPAEDTWVDGNFNWRLKNGAYTDGKINAKLNGLDWFTEVTIPTVEQVTEVLTQAGEDPNSIQAIIESGSYLMPGERNYFFKSGETLSFDYLIEWNIT